MGQFFLSILDLSAKASILILAVLLLRLLLKKAPRHMVCLLWLLVGLRLVVPISVESALSLMPSAAPVSSRVELSQRDSETIRQQEIILPDDTQVNIVPLDVSVPNTPSYIPEQNTSSPIVTQPEPAEPQPTPMSGEQIAALVWLCGFAAMLLYLVLSYLLLRRRVAESVPHADGVWKCPGLSSPFVLGFFRPRIYLSGSMDAFQNEYVISHERAHIARRDHITKPLGFVILAVHWFNPLVWLSYLLLCRDIELACDERVVKDMSLDQRKGYSQALLACSVRAKPLAACPLAFGEVGVKQRIKSVLSYKKPAFWVIITAVLCLIAASVFFLTDPKEDTTPTDDELSQSADDDADPIPSQTPTPTSMPSTEPTHTILAPPVIEDKTIYSIKNKEIAVTELSETQQAAVREMLANIVHNEKTKHEQSWNELLYIIQQGDTYIFFWPDNRVDYQKEGQAVHSYYCSNIDYSVLERIVGSTQDVMFFVDDDVVHDIDGDGIDETITRDKRGLLRINGKAADLGSVEYDYTSNNEHVLVVDIDPTDSWMEIVVEAISSDSPAYNKLHFFHFDTSSWNAQYLGSIPASVDGLEIHDGYITSFCSFNMLPDLKVSVPWKLEDGSLVMMDGTNEPGFYYIARAQWYTLDRDVIAYTGQRYEEISSAETLLDQGLEIWPLGYHLNGWLNVMDENEEKYWINLSRSTPIPDGTAHDPGLFYPLEIPIGTSIAADLDGDGIEELIYQNYNDVPAKDLYFTINGVDYSDVVSVHTINHRSYYITDLEKTDGKLEITVFDEGPSGDPKVHFFQYTDGELHYVGMIPYWFNQLRFDGDSYVLGAFRLSVLQTWYAGAAWRYADGQLQFIEQDFYHALVRDTLLDWTTGQEIEHHYALCDMYVYTSKNLESQPLVLRGGTQFDLLGTDNKEWILLQTLDGEQYWLHTSLDNPEGRKNSMDIIAGLDKSS